MPVLLDTDLAQTEIFPAGSYDGLSLRATLFDGSDEGRLDSDGRDDGSKLADGDELDTALNDGCADADWLVLGIALGASSHSFVVNLVMVTVPNDASVF